MPGQGHSRTWIPGSFGEFEPFMFYLFREYAVINTSAALFFHEYVAIHLLLRCAARDENRYSVSFFSWPESVICVGWAEGVPLMLANAQSFVGECAFVGEFAGTSHG